MFKMMTMKNPERGLPATMMMKAGKNRSCYQTVLWRCDRCVAA